MSKPIKIPPELKQRAVQEFAKALAEMKMTDGKVNYSKNFAYENDEKARILFTPTAYAKMVSLLMMFESEVAWHGVGERMDEKTFMISDILVYPQTVTGTTVDMDTAKYAMWLMQHGEDDRFGHIIAQGHSHVHMQTSPSSVDKTHQEAILAQLTDDMYYIFMIWNKHLEHTTKIYDLQNNTMYEDNDIEYGILDEQCDIDEFIKEAHKMIIEHYQYGGGSGYNDNSGGYGGHHSGGQSTPPATTTSKSKNKAKQKGKSDIGDGRVEDMDDDYAYDYYGARNPFYY
jgi:hypothetical protein